jgi:DNA-binding NarL/FixJ family response regulator
MQDRKNALSKAGRQEDNPFELTTREAEVLQLITEGQRNKGVAEHLGISIKTVEKHRQSVMNKLNIHETAGLTRYALKNGMLSEAVAVKP